MKSSLFSSFLTGLVITLGDQKATLFYLEFLPVFLDISKISYWDTIAVILVAAVAVGGVKLIYALMADKVSAIASSKIKNRINYSCWRCNDCDRSVCNSQSLAIAQNH